MPTSRNAACPCGSGKKFKFCHGAVESAPDVGRPASPYVIAQLAEATAALQRGNLPLTDLICRELLEQDPAQRTALALLGDVACRAGRFDVAVKYYTQVLHHTPHLSRVKTGLDHAKAALEAQRSRSSPALGANPRVLLIKAWGYGFWSDVDHVAGQLLVADIANRTPIVYWGSNSLFSAPQIDNAFELYFLPVSAYAVKDVVRPGTTLFPSKWHCDNLLTENVNKWDGPGSRLTGLYFFNRDEDVVVSDFHTYVNDLVPWIDPGSQYFGLGREEIYRRIFARHLRLQSHLESRIDDFWRENMAGRQWLAVHVRGSDKVGEVEHLAALNAAYFARVDEFVRARPQLSIFLLTDSEPVVKDFQHRYGARLLHSACTRTATTTGVHYCGHPGQRIAEEVILDTYLAARCDFFLGNGASNVSTTVRHLKRWAQGAYALLERDMLSVRNTLLHQW